MKSSRLLILNLGCGNRKGEGEIGLDIQPPADVIWNLNEHPLPFSDGEFSEIRAFHVLEHFGKQGDFKFFFEEWNEYYRILEDGGIFHGIVPQWNGIWAFGDPGHVRVLPSAILTYLIQGEYDIQVGVTGMTDYRKWYSGNFEILSCVDMNDGNLDFVLRKK